MTELTVDDVATLARVLDLALTEDDLMEAMHWLNMVVSQVESFSHPDLDTTEPIPFLPLDEVDDGL